MNILILDSTTEGDEEFNKPLINLLSGVCDSTVQKPVDIGSPKALDGFDALVISGVPIDYPYHLAITLHRVIRYAVKQNIPMIGVCLGHEGIGTFFGSKLMTARVKVDGVYKMNVRVRDPIFNGLPDAFLVRELHEASITVPDEFELLASSNRCRNMAMRHKDKPIYGLQFHPEFLPLHGNILKNFINIASTYDHGMVNSKD